MPSMRVDGVKSLPSQGGFEPRVADPRPKISENAELMDYAVRNRGSSDATEVQHVLGVDDQDLELWDYAKRNPESPTALEAKNLIFEKIGMAGSVPINEREQNPTLSYWDRFKVKWESDPEVQLGYLKRKGYEARLVGGNLEAKSPGQDQFYSVDPTGFDYFDVVDIVPEILEGVGFAAATPATKTIPGGAAIGALTGAAVEGIRQTGSKLMGVRENYDPARMGTAALFGGAFEGMAGGVRGARAPIREDAAKIIEANKRLNIPTTPGQLTRDETFRTQEAQLLKSPTVGGALTRRGYKGFDEGINKAAEEIFADRLGPEQTATRVGERVKNELLGDISQRAEGAGKTYNEIRQKYGGTPLNDRNKRPIHQAIEELRKNKDTEVQNYLSRLENELGQVGTLEELDIWSSSLGGKLTGTSPNNLRAINKRLYGPTETAIEKSLKNATKTVKYDFDNLPSTTKEVPDIGGVSPITFKRLFEERPSNSAAYKSAIRLGDFTLRFQDDGRVDVSKAGKSLTDAPTWDMDTFGSGDFKQLKPGGIKLADLPKFLAEHDTDGSAAEALKRLRIGGTSEQPKRRWWHMTSMAAKDSGVTPIDGNFSGRIEKLRDTDPMWDARTGGSQQVHVPTKQVETPFWEGVLSDPKLKDTSGFTNLSKNFSIGRTSGDTLQIYKGGVGTVATIKDPSEIGKAILDADPSGEIASALARKGYKIPKSVTYDSTVRDAKKGADATYRNLFKDYKQSFPLYPERQRTANSRPRTSVEDLSNRIEAIPPESLRDRFFDINKPEMLSKQKEKFGKQFEFLRRSELSRISAGAEVNGQISPERIKTQLKKMEPEAKAILFGDKALDAQAFQDAVESAVDRNFNRSGSGVYLEFSAPQNMKSIFNYIKYRLQSPSSEVSKAPSAVAKEGSATVYEYVKNTGKNIDAGQLKEVAKDEDDPRKRRLKKGTK